MKKFLLTLMTTLGLAGLGASAANAQLPQIPNLPLTATVFPTVQTGPVAISAGLSFGAGFAVGQGNANGFGDPGTFSGGVAGYQSIGQGGGTTFQNAVLGCGDCNSDTLKIHSSTPNQFGTAFFNLESSQPVGNDLNNHTYAGGTSFAIGGGATSGYAFANTNGFDPVQGATGHADSFAAGVGLGASIAAATTLAPICFGSCVAQP